MGAPKLATLDRVLDVKDMDVGEVVSVSGNPVAVVKDEGNKVLAYRIMDESGVDLIVEFYELGGAKLVPAGMVEGVTNYRVVHPPGSGHVRTLGSGQEDYAKMDSQLRPLGL